MQTLPAGIETPIKDRKCDFCEQIFMSKRGLTYHQSLKKNVNCYRAGIHRKRKYWSDEKLQNQIECKKKRQFENHPSLDEKHQKGQAFSAPHKQTCLNVYQQLRNDGYTKASSIGKVKLFNSFHDSFVR